jgi:hypothetical protein
MEKCTVENINKGDNSLIVLKTPGSTGAVANQAILLNP